MIIEGAQYNATSWFNFSSAGIKTVIFKFSEPVVDLLFFFEECVNLISADFTHFDTSELEIVFGLFKEANSLKSVVFGENFSIEKSISMEYLF